MCVPMDICVNVKAFIKFVFNLLVANDVCVNIIGFTQIWEIKCADDYTAIIMR